MIKQFFAAATIVTALASIQTEASFVHTDWKTEGDKLAVLHVETGLEWLNLYQTNTYTISSMKVALSNGMFSGWRIATYDEVITLWESLLKTNLNKNQTPPLRNIGDPAGQYLGHYSFGAHNYTLGFVEWYDGSSFIVGTSSVIGGSFYNERASTHSASGVYLVSDGGTTLSSINNPTLNINNPNAPINQGNPAADVASPAGLAAAGALLMLLGARRRKLRG